VINPTSCREIAAGLATGEIYDSLRQKLELVSRERVAGSDTLTAAEARVGFEPTPRNREIRVSRWRRGSESNEVFTDNQPQYPDLQGFKRFLILSANYLT